MADLIDSDYFAAVYGQAVEDTDRLETLISSASNMVQEYCRQTWTLSTAPETVKSVVANMVADTLTASGGKGALRAEQIGDYRYENQPGRMRGLDVGPYQDLLSRYRIRSYSIITPVPEDNPTYAWRTSDDEYGEGDGT